jgi:cruciform cutting endonuclease 1
MSRFASLKLAQIKPLLTAIGSRTSGTKPQLIARLERDLRAPKLILKEPSSTRILSVDMGIKNLAFCVCDVKKHVDGFELRVNEWKKIGVLDLQHAIEGQIKEVENPYAPPSLSKTAYHLVKDVLLPYQPDTVLIERQRFRSGGGTAVLEWTLRVNVFESMIWAVARTLQGERGVSPQHLWPLDPKQVATFWVGGSTTEKRTHMSKSKIEKKQKIDLVRKWLVDGADDSMILSFTNNAAETKRSFLAVANGNQKSKPDENAEGGKPVVVPERIGKLDDLADCLLQATAWCKWENNRDSLVSVLEEKDEFEP